MHLVWMSALTGCANLTAPDPAEIWSGPAEPADEPLPDPSSHVLAPAVAGWQWVDLPNTVCRDGSATGIAVQVPVDALGQPRSDKLLVFLQGGNACMNTGCIEQVNPSHFTESDWDEMLCEQLSDCSVDVAGCPVEEKWNNADDLWLGVLDGHPDNPFADWTKVFVPYCSGDWHAGENPDPIAIGSGESVFMGAPNTREALAAIRDVVGIEYDQVLVTGASAGGIGAILNFHKFADLFGTERTYLLSDAGPFYPDDQVESCLQARLKNLWRMDRNFPVLDGCPGLTCAWNDDAWMTGRWTWLLDTYGRGHADDAPIDGSRMALVISDRDSAATTAFELGKRDCARMDDLYFPLFLPYNAVAAATDALRTDIFDQYHDVKMFEVEGTTHHMWTWRQKWWETEFRRGTERVLLADWVAAMLSEDPTWDHAQVTPYSPTTESTTVEAVRAEGAD